jgi:hypothetical protein
MQRERESNRRLKELLPKFLLFACFTYITLFAYFSFLLLGLRSLSSTQKSNISYSGCSTRAISHRLVTAEARIRDAVSPCGMWRTTQHWGTFFSESFGFLQSIIPPLLHTHLHIICGVDMNLGKRTPQCVHENKIRSSCQVTGTPLQEKYL